MEPPIDISPATQRGILGSIPKALNVCLAVAALAGAAAAAIVLLTKPPDLPDPVAPGFLGVFVAEFQGKNAQEDSKLLVSALRDSIGGSDSPFGKLVESRSLPARLSQKQAADGKAGAWARALRANVILGRTEPDGKHGKRRPIAWLRLPDSTTQSPRPDLDRLTVRVAYPDYVELPRWPQGGWPAAAKVARGHLLLCAGMGNEIRNLFADETIEIPDDAEWAGYHLAAGSMALAAAVSAGAETSLLDLAVEHLTSAQRGWQDRQALSDCLRARLNLAAALTMRNGEGTEGVSDTQRAERILDQTRESIEASADAGLRAFGSFLLASAYAGKGASNSAGLTAIGRSLERLDACEQVWTPESAPYAWASAQALRARTLRRQSALGQVAAHDKAVEAAEEAAKAWDLNQFPGERAEMESLLGSLLLVRPRGDRLDNLNNARKHFTTAIEVWEGEGAAEALARDLANRASVLMQLAGGAPEANLRDGIADLEKALEKTSRQKNPAEWARIQNHLGVAIRRLDGGKSETRFREAIEHFNAALEVRTPEEYPVECAQTLCNLANAFRDYPAANRKESLEKSLDAYDAAIDALHFGKDYQIEQQIETNKKHAEAVYRALPAEAKSQ